jgi:hypothetical protein
MMGIMLVPMNAMSSSTAFLGAEGFCRTFITIGINTTHAAVRGT